MSRSFGRGLWSLIRRMFGAPGGRHAAGSPAPAASTALVASTPSAESTAPPGLPEAARIPVIPDIVASAGQASPPGGPTTGPASIRLIFTDGSVVPLPEGSVEGRQAQYLARRVLEVGRRP